jgi:putative nucleotidyltransferase with HDIG domain
MSIGREPGNGQDSPPNKPFKLQVMKWSMTDNKEWQHLEATFQWVSNMRGVNQDPLYHKEGDVAVHTKMVLEKLAALPEFKSLENQQQELLWAAALLHDVEKYSTTVEENGRITSKGHAKKGEFSARRILFKDIPTPFAMREQIASLVKYHGLPLWAMEKPNPTKSLLEASLRVDMPLLSLLAKADVLGRICDDQQELLDRIEFFVAFCQEQKCLHSARTFSSPLARFVYFHKEDSYPDYSPYDDLKGEVTMLSGLPGMGKDTYLKNNCPGLAVVSLDEIRRKYRLQADDPSATGWVVQQAKEQSKVFLRKGEPFAWNATNITRQMRMQWIDLFVSYKARVKLIYIEKPYNEWIRQNNNRENPVPHKPLMRLLNKLEVPSLHEAHEVQYVV